MKSFTPLILTLGVLMSALPAFAETPAPEAPAAAVPLMAPNAVEFKLSNGMQVVVIPDHRAPVVTHMVWYRVGAADETAGQSGIAHFLEHLMFKGTKAHPGDEFRTRVAAIGGDENAFTSSDYTAYFQRVAKENLGEMMAFESDRMTNLVLTDEVVATERDVVLNERRDRVEKNPDADAQRSDAAHPLFQPSLRAADHRLEPRDPRARPADGARFLQALLHAEQRGAGRRRRRDARRGAPPRRGDLRQDHAAARGGARAAPAEPPAVGPRAVTVRDEKVHEPQLQRAYIVPSNVTAEPGEAEALNLLAEILGGGATSRFYDELVRGEGRGDLCRRRLPRGGLDDIALHHLRPAEARRVADRARGSHGSGDREAAERRASARRSSRAPSARRSRRRSIRSTTRRRSPTSSGRRSVSRPAACRTCRAGPSRMQAVTVAQVQAVARKIPAAGGVRDRLPGARGRGEKLMSLSAFPRLSAILAGAVMTIALVSVRLPARAATVQEITSPGGIKAWLVEDYTVPIVTMNIAFRGGAAQDPVGKAGPRQPDVRASRRGRRRARFPRFPGKARGSQHQDDLRRRVGRLLQQLAHAKHQPGRGVRALPPRGDEPRFDAEPVARIRGQIIANLRQGEIQSERDGGQIVVGDALQGPSLRAGRRGHVGQRRRAHRRGPARPSTPAPWRATICTSSSSARSTARRPPPRSTTMFGGLAAQRRSVAGRRDRRRQSARSRTRR